METARPPRRGGGGGGGGGGKEGKGGGVEPGAGAKALGLRPWGPGALGTEVAGCGLRVVATQRGASYGLQSTQGGDAGSLFVPPPGLLLPPPPRPRSLEVASQQMEAAVWLICGLRRGLLLLALRDSRASAQHSRTARRGSAAGSAGGSAAGSAPPAGAAASLLSSVAWMS